MTFSFFIQFVLFPALFGSLVGVGVSALAIKAFKVFK